MSIFTDEGAYVIPARGLSGHITSISQTGDRRRRRRRKLITRGDYYYGREGWKGRIEGEDEMK